MAVPHNMPPLEHGASPALPKPKAINLSHHLSKETKGMSVVRYNGADYWREGTVSLDSGVPPADYYPIESINVEYLHHASFPLRPLDVLPHKPASGGLYSYLATLISGEASGPQTATYTIPRRLEEGSRASQFELKTALAYSPTTGLKKLEKWIYDWVGRVHQPAYSDWDIFIDIGAADAWPKCVRLLMNPEEAFLTDAYAYNVAVMQAKAINVTAVAVESDEDGLSAVDLRRILSTWDEAIRKIKRPRVLYTQGGIHNPTGRLMSTKRKKEVYEVCVDYDVVIVEDDPYFFQQASQPYAHATARTQTKDISDNEWLDSLVPSFLRLDYQGRVIRIDTFSKTIGPGGRLGFFTTSPILRAKLGIITRVTSQAPSGVSQAVFGQLLYTYGQDGFIRWLRGLTAQYEFRRDFTIDALHEHLRIVQDQDTSALISYKKVPPPPSGDHSGGSKKSLMSFIPPMGGMFIWFAIHLQNHHGFHSLCNEMTVGEAKTKLADQLWREMAEAGLLLRPGELFAVDTAEARARAGEEVIYLRASFSSNEPHELKKGMGIFAEQLVQFFDTPKL